jgi:hypothetical protein
LKNQAPPACTIHSDYEVLKADVKFWKEEYEKEKQFKLDAMKLLNEERSAQDLLKPSNEAPARLPLFPAVEMETGLHTQKAQHSQEVERREMHKVVDFSTVWALEATMYRGITNVPRSEEQSEK